MNKNSKPNTELTKREQQVYQLIIAGNQCCQLKKICSPRFPNRGANGIASLTQN